MDIRIEFFEQEGIYGVNIVIGNNSLTFNDKHDPITYDFFSRAFMDIPGKMEYPRDDSGIEVHKLVLA
jgi:hypothetical protein